MKLNNIFTRAGRSWMNCTRGDAVADALVSAGWEHEFVGAVDIAVSTEDWVLANEVYWLLYSIVYPPPTETEDIVGLSFTERHERARQHNSARKQQIYAALCSILQSGQVHALAELERLRALHKLAE